MKPRLPAMVRPESETSAPAATEMIRNRDSSAPGAIASETNAALGPSRAREPLSSGSGVSKLMVPATSGAKVMVSPSGDWFASSMADRREPTPESARVVTVSEDQSTGVGGDSTVGPPGIEAEAMRTSVPRPPTPA